jgi:hypothetical protein
MMNEDKLTAAAASVAEWQTNVRTINEKIVKAAGVFAESQKIRQEHVLAAALGDHDARERLNHVLEDDRKARELEDLRSSLPLAEAALANAQRAQKSAEVEWRRTEVERLACARVKAAAAIDEAFADFSRAWATFESIGHELIGLASAEPGANALYLSETVDGVGRLVASLPRIPFLAIKERYPFMAVSTSKSLAAAEAAYWRLPPADEAKAA